MEKNLMEKNLMEKNLMEEYFNSNLGDFGVASYKEYVEKYPDQAVLKADYLNHNVKILSRQTSYTLEECNALLKTKSLEQCIKDFLGIIPPKKRHMYENTCRS